MRMEDYEGPERRAQVEAIADKAVSRVEGEVAAA